MEDVMFGIEIIEVKKNGDGEVKIRYCIECKEEMEKLPSEADDKEFGIKEVWICGDCGLSLDIYEGKRNDEWIKCC